MELIFLLFLLLGGLATCGFSVAILVIQYLQKRQLRQVNKAAVPQFQGRPAPRIR